MFRRNVGGIDRVLRLTLGGTLFLGGLLLLSSTVKLGVILAVIGLLALLTGIVGFCALYIPFDISTRRTGEQPLKQACHCAAWTKAVQDNRTAAPRTSASRQ
jgi:hypothetical protein